MFIARNPTQNTQDHQEEAHMVKRYYVHDFLIGNPILLDTHEKTYAIYSANIHGQIFDLESAKKYRVTNQKIAGVIRKLNGRYDSNGLVIDRYIYTYFLTDDQRAKCRWSADLWKMDTLIAETDDLCEAVRTMCEWVYENQYCGSAEEKERDRKRLMKYCDAYLDRLSA